MSTLTAAVGPNQKYGRLTVLRVHQSATPSTTVWECKCECGNTAHVVAARLVRRTPAGEKNRSTRSCGCLAREKYKGNLGHARRVKTETKNLLANEKMPYSPPLQPGEAPRTVWQRVRPWTPEESLDAQP